MKVWFALVFLIGFFAEAEATAGEKPNIVLIFAGDCGWGDVPCNNPKAVFQVPK
jgi:arylsulfatase A-like enzyme